MANLPTLSQKIQAIRLQMFAPGKTLDESKSIFISWLYTLPAPEQSKMVTILTQAISLVQNEMEVN